MKYFGRLTVAGLALFAPNLAGAGAGALIGGCEVMGVKGDMPVASPLKAGQLTVAVSLPAPIWWNGDSPATIKDGFEDCLAASMAWRAGYDKFEIVNVDWPALLAGEAKGFDLALSEIPMGAARQKAVAGSAPYFNLDLAVVVKKAAELDEKSIKDKRVGVQQGTRAAEFVTGKLKPKSALQYAEQGEMFAALRAGQIDAAIVSAPNALAEEVQERGEVEVIGQYKTGESFSALYPPDSANAAAFDKLLIALQADGTLKTLAQTYLVPVWGKDPATLPYFTP